MTESREIMLRATMDVVSQCGMRKTSVGKIADAAGLSRQTVYNAFGSKEEILRAAMEFNGERKRHIAHQASLGVDSINEKLDALFEHLYVSAYKFTKANPEADDLIVQSHAIGGEVLAASFESQRKIFEGVFDPYTDELQICGLTAKQLSDTVEKAARASKREARSVRHLREMLETLKVMVLNLIATN